MNSEITWCHEPLGENRKRSRLDEGQGKTILDVLNLRYLKKFR
jgi:hypothetical protein